jgi:hypothetical protein
MLKYLSTPSEKVANWAASVNHIHSHSGAKLLIGDISLDIPLLFL